MENKQTALEYYIYQIFALNQALEYKEIDILEFQKLQYHVTRIAKEMEKEQIREAHFTASGCNSFDMPIDRIDSAYKAAEQYYNETYKTD